MVKPGSIIGGFVIAISIALQIVTLLEIAQYWWLLFIWASGLIGGVCYVLGGLAFTSADKTEWFTISGIGFGAIISLAAYFILFQWDGMVATLIVPNQYWIIGAVGFSVLSAILVSISTLFIVAGTDRAMKGIKPGAIIGGVLISLSLVLQIIVVVHIKKAYWLLIFWFIGMIGAIGLSIGARSRGYTTKIPLVIGGICIGVLLFLVLYFTLSENMRDAMDNAKANTTNPPSHPLSAIWATIMSFISGLVSFIGILFVSASNPRNQI